MGQVRGGLLFLPFLGPLLPRHYLIVATGGTAFLLAGLPVAGSLPAAFALPGMSAFLIALTCLHQGGSAAPPKPTDEVVLLTEIRDALRRG